MKSKILWTDAVWNPVTGCDKISSGCKNCYAERMAKRLKGRHGYPANKPFSVTPHPDRLTQPMSWKKPRRVFVNSMSDLFHKSVPNEFIAAVFGVMAQCPQHTFQILTKRPERAVQWFRWVTPNECCIVADHADIYLEKAGLSILDAPRMHLANATSWPLENVCIGITAEDQKMYDVRFPSLVQIPAAVKCISVEPMLEGLDLSLAGTLPNSLVNGHQAVYDHINWVICGCESGPKARPMMLRWAGDLLHQCRDYDIPFFFKQRMLDGKLIKMPKLDGRVWAQFPE